MGVTKKEINISEFLTERVDFFYEISEGNHHKVVIESDKDIILYFSPEELQRMIDNNLSNAIKYANKNTTIRISLHKKEQEVILKFLSYSPKIEDTKRIFRAFERENNVKGGFGLGLEIVYTICMKENIKIELTSDDKNTIFTYIFQKDAQ